MTQRRVAHTSLEDLDSFVHGWQCRNAIWSMNIIPERKRALCTMPAALRVRKTLMSFLLCLALTSCVPVQPLPDESDVVGVWVFSPKDSTYKASVSDGFIDFKEDGTFTLDQIPLSVLFRGLSETVTSPETGTWKIVKRQIGVDEPSIEMRTKGSAAYSGTLGFYLTSEGSGRSRRLVRTIGDPDDYSRYVLKKGS